MSVGVSELLCHSRETTDYLVARYRIVPAEGVSAHRAAELIAAEESTGIESVATSRGTLIFSPVTGESAEIQQRHRAKVLSIQSTGISRAAIVDIAFPIYNLMQAAGGIPLLLSTIMGDLFGLAAVKSVRLEDLAIPAEYVTQFKGPKFGVKGIRSLLDIEESVPLIGAILKPNLGNSYEETARICQLLSESGMHFIKDDELLVSMPQNLLEDRVAAVMGALDKARAKTGMKTLYAVNITSALDQLIPTAMRALDAGANCLMVNFLATGLDGLRMLTHDPRIRVPIHTHRCMHDIFTRNPIFGVSMPVLAQLARLCGADLVHIGSIPGKTPSQVAEIVRSCDMLRREWHGFEATLPVTSRMYAGSVARTIECLGRDLLLLACGGIHRHPLGRDAGVRSLSQATSQVLSARPLGEEDRVEFDAALREWPF